MRAIFCYVPLGKGKRKWKSSGLRLISRRKKKLFPFTPAAKLQLLMSVIGFSPSCFVVVEKKYRPFSTIGSSKVYLSAPLHNRLPHERVDNAQLQAHVRVFVTRPRRLYQLPNRWRGKMKKHLLILRDKTSTIKEVEGIKLINTSYSRLRYVQVRPLSIPLRSARGEYEKGFFPLPNISNKYPEAWE